MKKKTFGWTIDETIGNKLILNIIGIPVPLLYGSHVLGFVYYMLVTDLWFSLSQKSNCMYAEVVGDREHHQRGLNWMKEARDMVEERLVDSPCCLRKLPEADSVSNHDSKEVEQHKSKEAEEHKNSHHDRKEAEKHTSHHDEEAQHKTSHHDNEEAEHKTSHHDEEVQHKTSRHENKEAEQNKTYNHDTEEPEEHKNSPHCCRECGSGIGFVTWEDLQQHKVQRHGGHKCSTCGIVVKTRRTLRLHMHAHMDTVHECMVRGRRLFTLLH